MALTYLIILLALVITFVVYQLIGFKSLAPWVPSKSKVLAEALEYLNLPAGTTFIDLGAGDGRTVFLASKKFNFEATGVELAPLIWGLSKVRQLLGRHFQVKLLLSDYAKLNLSSYKVIFIYSLPENINNQIIAKLKKELQPGSWIISYNFTLTGQQPVKTLADKWRRLYIYKV